MGLNLSKEQIAEELDLNRSDVHQMVTQLREGGVKETDVILQDIVELDEVYALVSFAKLASATSWSLTRKTSFISCFFRIHS